MTPKSDYNWKINDDILIISHVRGKEKKEHLEKLMNSL